MGFFGRAGDRGTEQDGSLSRVEAGGIPLGAEQRLKALSGDDALFTSGLSVNEFALLGRMGPRPLAQVMGASVVRTGWQYLPALEPGKTFVGPWYGPTPTGRALQNVYTEPSISQVRAYRWHSEVVCELDVLTDAWNLARRRAFDRLREEALTVGADAVVGVHLQSSDRDLGKGTIEYIVSGTAIRLPGSSGNTWPTLTDLSVQDYWRLHSLGHEPAGIAATTIVVFASASRSTQLQRKKTTYRNQELVELSRAFHSARETVRARLVGQISDAHGIGAVGVEFTHAIDREKLALASSIQTSGRWGWHMGRFGLPYRVSGRSDIERKGWVITMHAAGTAIGPSGRSTSPEVKPMVRMRAR